MNAKSPTKNRMTPCSRNHNPGFVPTAAEVWAAAEEIRRSWTRSERQRRQCRAEVSQWTLLGRLHGPKTFTG
jgi:hypothetical protein